MWQKYDGGYNKQCCNVKLKNGDIVFNCWPNAGLFNEMQGQYRTVKGENVVEIEYISIEMSEELARQSEEKQIGYKPPKKKKHGSGYKNK